MIKVVLCRNNYYLFDGFNFYGSFHSCAEAEFRAPEKEKYKIEKRFVRYTVIKTLAY